MKFMKRKESMDEGVKRLLKSCVTENDELDLLKMMEGFLNTDPAIYKAFLDLLVEMYPEQYASILYFLTNLKDEEN